MADIRVQEKQGPGMWVWVVGALGLALLIWLLVSMMGSDRRTDSYDTAPPPAAVEPAPAPGAAQPGTTPPETDPGAAPGTGTTVTPPPGP